MELKDLIGKKLLTAVDFGTVPPKSDSYHDGNSATMTFVLDGVAYTVVEDANDGYRSSMKDITITPDYKPVNVFEPIEVLVMHLESSGKSYMGSCDIIRAIDTKTGKTVLEAGTENTDDYYPSYVANFTPENMASNTSERMNADSLLRELYAVAKGHIEGKAETDDLLNRLEAFLGV